MVAQVTTCQPTAPVRADKVTMVATARQVPLILVAVAVAPVVLERMRQQQMAQTVEVDWPLASPDHPLHMAEAEAQESTHRGRMATVDQVVVAMVEQSHQMVRAELQIPAVVAVVPAAMLRQPVVLAVLES